MHGLVVGNWEVAFRHNKKIHYNGTKSHIIDLEHASNEWELYVRFQENLHILL